MFYDLVGLSDREWGWDSDYQILQATALEAIINHPIPYIKGAISDFGKLFVSNPLPTIPVKQGLSLQTEDSNKSENPNTMPEGRIVPFANLWWVASSPDHRVENFGMPLIPEQNTWLAAHIPTRDGWPAVSIFLSYLNLLYPIIATWILVGVFSLFTPIPNIQWLLFFLSGISLVFLGITSLMGEPVWHYRIPFDPLFILLGVTGLINLLRFFDVRQ